MAYLIVDGNNIGYKAWIVLQNAENKLSTSTGIQTTVLVTILRSMEYAIDSAGLGTIDGCIVTWDKGKAYRKGLFPLYKAHRDTSKIDYENLIENFTTAQKYLEKLGVQQMFIDGMEADDIIGYVTKVINKKLNKSVYVFSDDSDFFQLLKHRLVRQYRPSSQKIVTEDDFLAEYKIMPRYFNRMIAIMGQGKDNIPGCLDMVDGVPKKIGLGEVKAVKLLTRPDGTIRTLREVLEECQDDKFYPQIKKNFKQMLLSYKLSKLRTKKEEYSNEEYKYLKDKFEQSLKPPVVKLSTVHNITEFLEIRKTNVVKILKKIGVPVK